MFTGNSYNYTNFKIKITKKIILLLECDIVITYTVITTETNQSTGFSFLIYSIGTCQTDFGRTYIPYDRYRLCHYHHRYNLHYVWYFKTERIHRNPSFQINQEPLPPRPRFSYNTW